MSAILNRFPSEGALNLETVSFSAGDILHGIPPTAPLPHVIELRQVCEAYLRRIPTREKGQGRCFLIRGENGTGKTHAIGDSLLRVASSSLIAGRYDWALFEGSPEIAESAVSRLRRPVVLYAKASGDSDSIVPIFKDLFGRLTSTEWTQLGRDAMSMLASGQPSADEDLVEQFLGKLRTDRGTLWGEQSTALRSTSRGRDDFAQAFSYLLGSELGRDSTLSEVARNWLIGQDVAETDRRKLGVKGTISRPEDAAQAIQFLAILCGLADRPLVVAIDQVEKIAIHPDSSPALQPLGIFHSLVEIIPRENGMLLLAGTSQAWDAFPTDLQKRIGNNVILCDRLSLTSARNVIAIYLHPLASRTRTKEASDEELQPFQAGAVKKMLDYSGGTIRRFLQLASTVFEQSSATTDVNEEMIETTAKRSAIFRNDPDSVRLAIRAVLQKRGLAFAEELKIGDRKVDFTQFSAGTIPRVLIQISRSVFFLDELRRASELLALSKIAAKLPHPPMLIGVFAGYASPEVIKELQRVCHSVIVYDPETFDKVLGTLFDTLPRLSSDKLVERESVSASTKTLIERIDQIDAALKRIAKDREPVYRALEADLEAEGWRQVAPRQSGRRQEALRAWRDERFRIEDQIRQARKKRADEEMSELRKLRDAGESARRRSADILTGVVGIVGIIALLFLGLKIRTQLEQSQILTNAVSSIREQLSQKELLLGKSRDVIDRTSHDEAETLETEFSRTEQQIAALMDDASGSAIESSEAKSRIKELRDSFEARFRLRYADVKAYLSLKSLEDQLEKALERQRTIRKTIYDWGLGVAVVVFVLVIVLIRSLGARHLIASGVQRALSEPVDNVGDLAALAYRFLQKFPRLVRRYTKLSSSALARVSRNPLNALIPVPRAFWELIWDSNPHFRYAAALAVPEVPQISKFYGPDLAATLRHERAAVVRRALATSLGRTLGMESVLEEAIDVPEIVYWIEEAVDMTNHSKSGLPDVSANIGLPKRLTVLRYVIYDSFGSLMRSFFSSANVATNLTKAFETNLDQQNLSFLEDISDVQLREAIKTVSPLEIGGLGCYDQLKVIDRIDDLYILFQQTRFYKGWGDLLVIGEHPSNPQS